MSSSTPGARTAGLRWENHELEKVDSCPVCNAPAGQALYSRLVEHDAGLWSLRRCLACRSAWLTPRPSEETIGRAYEGEYYTHRAPQGPPSFQRAKLLRALRNGHLNERFGYELQPVHRVGGLLGWMLPPVAGRGERFIRHLKRPAGGGRLLDVGCGSGVFVSQMRDLGWDAEGIDPDPQAIQRATVNGLSIHHATLGEWATPDHRDTYDAVTLSHVIEHFHDPVGALCDVASLLRPGGRIWIATPNLESAGHRYFGRYWRALDPPRHLVLFTVRSLLLALFRAEFEQAHVRRPAAQAEWLFSASALIARRGGHLPPRAGVLQGKARVADVVALWRPEIGEEVVVTAEKPNP